MKSWSKNRTYWRLRAVITSLSRRWLLGRSRYGPCRPVRRAVFLCIGALGANVLICRGQGRRAPQARQDLGYATWSVGNRELCEPRTEADRNPVTESNLSLHASAQRAAVRAHSGSRPGEDSGRHYVSPRGVVGDRIGCRYPTASDPCRIGTGTFRSGSMIPRCERSCARARQFAGTRPAESTLLAGSAATQPDLAVKEFPRKVQMPSMSRRLLDHVQHDPTNVWRFVSPVRTAWRRRKRSDGEDRL